MPEPTPAPEFVWTFLPGLHGTDELFEPIRTLLPQSQKCEWINLPTKGKQDYKTLAHWLDEHLPPIQGKKRLLIAESFSGPLAMSFAALRKDEIAGIILGASFCDAPLNPGIALLPLRPLFMVKPPRKALAYFLIGDDASDTEVSEVRRIIQSIPSSTLSKRVRAVLELEAKTLPSLKEIPMLLLQAQDDNLIPWEAQQRIESRYPDARVHWIDSPHMIFQRHPEECLKKMINFLEDSDQ